MARTITKSGFVAGMQEGAQLLLNAAPILVLTCLAAILIAWVLGPRSYLDKDGNRKFRIFGVHEFPSVLAIVIAISSFGAFQGYLIGSVTFDEASKTIAALIASSITFLSTIIALIYSQTITETVRRSVVPGIVGFLLCFIAFTGYYDAVRTEEPPPPARPVTPPPPDSKASPPAAAK